MSPRGKMLDKTIERKQLMSNKKNKSDAIAPEELSFSGWWIVFCFIIAVIIWIYFKGV